VLSEQQQQTHPKESAEVRITIRELCHRQRLDPIGWYAIRELPARLGSHEHLDPGRGINKRHSGEPFLPEGLS
jgi:hypothetical protein